MWRSLVLIGLFAALGLFFWQRSDERATRTSREATPDAIPLIPQDREEIVETEETVELRGIVRGDEDQPLAGVTVRVAQEPPVFSKTGSDGRFTMALPGENWVEVHLSHPEFLTLRTWGRTDHDNEFRLARGAPLTLIVLGPDGKPVAGAKASASTQQTQGARGLWTWSDTNALGGGTTNHQGRLAMGAVPETPFRLVVEHPAYARHMETVELGRLQPAEHVVRLDAGGSVAGTVFDREGNPLPDALVKAGHREGRTDASGHYRIDRVQVGFVTVRASKPEHAPGFFGQTLGWGDPVPVEVLADETTGGLDIRLGTPTWVTGRIADASGKPLADARVSVSVWGGYGDHPEFRSGKDGRFRAGPFAVIRRGRVHVYARADGHQPANAPQREISAGRSVDIGTLKLARSSVIRGRCVDADGLPVPRARVSIAPGFRNAVAKEDGTFELTNVRTGKVTIYARRGEIGSPNRRLEIADETALEDVELVLGPLPSISGRVTDGKGAARPDITLRAISGDMPVAWSARTDAEGRYSFDGLNPAQYKVAVVGYGDTWIWGEGPAGPEREVEAGAKDVDFEFPYTGGIVIAKVVSRRTGLPIRSFQYATIRYRAFIPNVDDVGTSDDREGSFRFEFKQEGKWALEFSAKGHAPFRTGKLDLKKGEEHDLGTIRLGEGGTIEGRVVDAQGAPVPHTRINILSPKLETNDEEPFTGRDGGFRISGVSPGLYMVFAVSPRHPIGMVKNILVKEAQTTRAEVRFAAPGPLEVIVKREDGNPLRGAKLFWSFPEIAPLTSKLVRNKIPPGHGDHRSDAEGRIFQHALPAGPVTLFIEAHGFMPVRRQVRLAPGKKTRIEISMTPKK
ncbi:MAG: carboxypeptidase regulatory-like domain-containing protein [Planctomycetota bacterium]|jgi:protocatechuate 3,4-dioxygenase beta subunit